MEFVDYKCLESLLIEGEELIATEGLSYKLSYRIKTAILNFFKMIGRMIYKLIGIIRAKFGKNKTNNKNETNESTKNHSSVNKEIMKNNSIKKPKKDGWPILEDAISGIDLFLGEVNNYTAHILEVGYKAENYLLSKLTRIEDKYEIVVSKCDTFHSIVNKDDYDFYFESKSKESVLNHLNELKDDTNKIIKRLENNSNNFEDTYSKYGANVNDPDYLDKETHDTYSATYSKYISLVSKCSGLISNIITDVQKI